MVRFDFKTGTTEYLDDLLGGNNGKANEEIDIDFLVEITEQPFKPYSDERLKMLMGDIKLNGLMSPLIVTKLEGSMMYEILAGRNRFNACMLLGMESVPCIVKYGLSEAQRNLILVNSNLMQRQSLLPSERAKAYKMQLKAYKELGIKSEWVESQATAYKYMRLNNLNDEFLAKVDSGEIQFTLGYELSGMSGATQSVISEYIEQEPKERLASAVEAIKGACSEPCSVGELKRLLELKEREKASKQKKSVPKLIVKMSAFTSELKDANLGKLLEVIIANEYDILRMYREGMEK